MYQTDPFIGMRTVTGHPIPLKSVNIEASFDNLLCNTHINHVYKNTENKPIEAVYTFPLSSQAVLLGVDVTIGDRELKGTVIEKSTAEEQYEDAITDGDAAIMLEQVEQGMFTLNVGNILSGEEVKVSIHYAELYSWNGDSLRFYLPTTIAPRYGSPDDSGLELHQIPEHDIIAENPFSLKLTLKGVLADAQLRSPSHEITVEKSRGTALISLTAEQSFMDRDFILNITLPGNKKDMVSIETDPFSGYVALASFMPHLPVRDDASRRNVKIIIDCSGSMSGDSITQARQAINDILALLRPEDFFNIIAFGSSYRIFFDEQVPADKTHITKVRRQLRNLEANMGGTELEDALFAALNISGPDIPADILLITDGEVWQTDQIIARMEDSGHRVFTVGVGSAVSETFLRRLSEITGGACELVVPNEEMTDKIVRHFKRIHVPRAEKVQIRWPGNPERIFPEEPGPVYDGDTLHAFAWYRNIPSGKVMLEMELSDGGKFSQGIDIDNAALSEKSIDSSATLARIGVACAIRNLEEETEQAVQYQLMTPYTNFIVVDVRDDKSQELPALRKVPQMVAAGWGGTGSVRRESYQAAVCDLSLEIDYAVNSDSGFFDKGSSPVQFVSYCNRLFSNMSHPVLMFKTYSDVRDCGVPESIIKIIKQVAENKYPDLDEEEVLVVFLLSMLQSNIGHQFNKNFSRSVKKAAKAFKINKKVIEDFAETFKNISEYCWE